MRDTHNLTKSEIFRWYNKAKAFARKNPQLVDPKRVDRALGILQTKGNYFEAHPWNASVTHCDCPDTLYRRVVCKHSVAMMILSRILQERWDHEITLLVSREKVEVVS